MDCKLQAISWLTDKNQIWLYGVSLCRVLGLGAVALGKRQTAA